MHAETSVQVGQEKTKLGLANIPKKRKQPTKPCSRLYKNVAHVAC